MNDIEREARDFLHNLQQFTHDIAVIEPDPQKVRFAQALLSRSTPPEEQEIKRLREIEHMVWHVLDDSAEDARTGRISIDPSDDYFKLCALLPEDHPGNESATVSPLGTIK